MDDLTNMQRGAGLDDGELKLITELRTVVKVSSPAPLRRRQCPLTRVCVGVLLQRSGQGGPDDAARSPAA